MAFDISAALGDIARKPAAGSKGRRELRYIPLHMIDTNPRNFYSTAGIDDLADNIRMFGLLEPLLVREGVSGRYMLISGHRRRLALKKIAEEAENYPESMHEPVACMVEADDAPLPGIETGGDDELRARQMAEELKLIYANADTRVMSSADTAQQVRRIRELFTGLRELGYQFPGKMRDHVAAAAKVSATRIARLDVIDRGLAEPTLRKAWKDGTLGETAAYEIARRPETLQKLALQRVGIGPLRGMTTEQVTRCLDACEADGNREREAREDWNRNVGTMAEAAGTADAGGNGKSDFSADAYLEKLHKESEAFTEMLDEVSDLFYDGLEYVTDRREGIELLKRMHGSTRRGGCGKTIFFDCSPKGLQLSGDKFKGTITRTWTEVFDELALAALRSVARGKVSAADTGAKLHDGTPTEPGEYMTRIGSGNEETPQTATWQRLEWHTDGNWCFPKTGAPIPKGIVVFRWFKLPEV